MGFAFDNIVMIRTIAMNMITVIGKKALPVTFLALLISTIVLPSSIAWAQETNGDYYTIKYDAQGNVLWSRAYDGGRWDYAYKVAVDGEGNIIVTGASEIWHDYNENGEQDEEEVNYDYYTIKYDSNGNEQWHAIYDGEARDEPFAMAVDSDGNVIVTGRSFNGTDYDYCTIKYDPEGGEAWVSRITSAIRELSRSTLLITTMDFRHFAIAWRSTNLVWGMGPSTESTRSKQPSAILMTRSTSPLKSACPGVSMILILTPL